MILWLGLFWVSFLLPFHLFPLPDLPNDVLGMVCASVLFFWCCIRVRSEKQLSVPANALALLGLLAIVALSAAMQKTELSFSDFSYLLFLLTTLLVALSVSQLKDNFGSEFLFERLAKSLVLIALITSAYGLLRYYGVLKAWLPWIVSDGDRLLGPLNQANLTALVVALGILAIAYLLITDKIRPSLAFCISIVFATTASLAGSRIFVGYVLILLALPLLKGGITFVAGGSPSRIFLGNGKMIGVLVVTVLGVAFLYPQLDRPISNHLIEAEIVERTTDQTLSDRFSMRDGYRADEWEKLLHFGVAVESPWFGVGPGRYGTFSFQADDLSDNPGRMGTLWVHSHNLFINTVVELGYLGVFVLLLICGYIFYLLCVSPFRPSDYFAFSVLGALFLSNMVEFSFWFFGFLALAVSIVTLVDKRTNFSFSSAVLPVSIGAMTLCVSILSASYVFNDYWASVKGFHKAELSEEEHMAFLDAKHNRFIGGNAFKAQIIREQPNLFAVDWQIRELERYISWRPEMVYLMRYSSLLAAKGDEDKACRQVIRTVSLFPNVLDRLVEEINIMKARGANFDIAKIQGCVADGMMYWVGRGLEDGEVSP